MHFRQNGILIAFLLFALPATAQVVGDCEPGTAEADLDINDVEARVFNSGVQFFNPQFPDPPFYRVPRGTDKAPIWSDGVLVAGLVNEEVRATTSYFGRPDFWPGPLGEGGVPPEECSVFDRVWLVSRADVTRYLDTGEVTDDLRDWPVELGAPVLDGDGVEGNYNLAGGDEPAISGDQTAWWVMNDAGNEHQNSLTEPIGLEVQVAASAVRSDEDALDQMTFYRYRLINRTNVLIDSAYVGFAGFFDLGDARGNLVGSDTTRDMAYVYHDASADAVYGPDPPAFGRLYLDTPVGLANGRDDDSDGVVDELGERLGMTASMFFVNSAPPPQHQPFTGPEMYYQLQGRWADGTPITEGGDGFMENGPVTTFMYPGDPLTEQCWSITNGCPGYVGQSQGRSISGTGPFRLEPGEAAEVVFALVFAQGVDHEDSLVELRRAAETVRSAYDAGFFDPVPVDTEDGAPPTLSYTLNAFPNPFTSFTSLTLAVPEDAGAARLAVFDVLGREVAVLTEGVLSPGEQTFTLDGAGLPSGLYLVRLATARQSETLKVLHVE